MAKLQRGNAGMYWGPIPFMLDQFKAGNVKAVVALDSSKKGLTFNVEATSEPDLFRIIGSGRKSTVSMARLRIGYRPEPALVVPKPEPVSSPARRYKAITDGLLDELPIPGMDKLLKMSERHIKIQERLAAAVERFVTWCEGQTLETTRKVIPE